MLTAPQVVSPIGLFASASAQSDPARARSQRTTAALSAGPPRSAVSSSREAYGYSPVILFGSVAAGEPPRERCPRHRRTAQDLRSPHGRHV
ncbi:hypothetical protein NDU88_007671 [Pleurodeles waltl]|uniref:Uncharacterized protein n=1 Tax=Pleurodeles waltl TaxID=8319 RepID=A0AAV7PMK1_PLEWA|nr:hypothetical protein NDU88_007671 [Pleurodeles waltl]